jgi:hypothetical protein
MNSTPTASASGGEDAQVTEPGGEVTDRPQPSRRLELATAIGAVLVFAIALVLARGIEIRAAAAPGQIDARFWPTVLAAAGLLLAIGRLVTVLVAAPEARDELDPRQRGGFRRVVLTLVVTVAYIAVWSIGDVIVAGYRIQIFPIATALFLAALLALHGARGWKAFVFFPLPLAIGTYLLFGMLLRIPL